MIGCGPQARAWRGIEIEQASELTHPVLACVTLGHDTAFSGAQQPSERRAAEVDDEVPPPACDGAIKWQPVNRPAPFLDDCEPLELGHGVEQRSGDWPRSNGQPRSRMALDQISEQTG